MKHSLALQTEIHAGYKANVESCSGYYIQNVVLNDLVLETVKKVAQYISEYESVFLYLYAKNHKLSVAKKMKTAKQKLEQAKKRIGELDKLLNLPLNSTFSATLKKTTISQWFVITRMSNGN